MPFQQLFGGQNIYPAQLTLLVVNPLDADIELQWPVEQAIAGQLVFADIMSLTPDDAGREVTFPDARNAGPGQSTLINNLGDDTIIINDHAGNEIGAVPSGEVWQFYLNDNTTEAGEWLTFQFGTGTSSAVAAALAGAGLEANANRLRLNLVADEENATPYALVQADRALAKLWTGGVGVFNAPDPATLGIGWFCYIRNSGSGTLTINALATYINTVGVTSLTLPVGASLILVSAGTFYFVLCQGGGVAGTFDFIAINVGGTGNYTLTGAELNRTSYRFTGTLTGNRNIIVPNTIQQYWVDNETNGAFTLTVKTAAGTGITVPQGLADILYCDGTDVVDAVTSEHPVPVTDGGTGLITIEQGDLLYGLSLNVYSRLTKDPNATRYLSNQGLDNAPLWDQVNLSNGVKNRLGLFNIVQGSALSVLGVAGNAVADEASITGTAGQVLRLNNGGTALGFGAVDLTNSASVIGALTVLNGGTGLNTVTQGDLLYASAADTISRLAKNTGTGIRFLANTGTSNNPAWLTPQYTGNVQFSADYTLTLGDSWRIAYHDSATPHRLTIPANGTTAFEIGTYIGFSNPSASGALTIAIGGPDNITGHGNATGTGDFIVIPPGYSGYVIKILAQLWLLVTDAPPTVAADTIYRGYVGSDGTTGNRLPAGWSATRTGTGAYTVTHNLGLADGTRLAVAGWPQAAAGNRTSYSTSANDGNQFFVGITDAGAGSASDQAFMFIAGLT